MKSLSRFFCLALGLTLCASAFAAAAAAPAPVAAPAADTRVYELRIYTTNPGKFDDLLARFRDHTMRLFERHGMRNVGYFTPIAGTEGAGVKLYYLLEFDSREAATAGWAAFNTDPDWVSVRTASEVGGAILAQRPESVFLKATNFSPALKTGYVSFRTPRVFELRRYTAAQGRLPALHAFFRSTVLGLFAKHGMTGMGFWEPLDADKGAGTELDYLLAFPSREAADTAWKNFRADPTYIQGAAEANKDSRLTVENGIKSIFLVPVDFSPIK